METSLWSVAGWSHLECQLVNGDRLRMDGPIEAKGDRGGLPFRRDDRDGRPHCPQELHIRDVVADAVKEAGAPRFVRSD
ncbi:hypothetical protein HPB50_006352 [Hyalomma asiaticum]|uniref:Uncharacterized protein n=1 Tax=Hyalomma asiaticum TaxID=266040 RepID=A0ACB7RXM3_HYAAI|nr:hypothetical protein HPB50_006352 [Hyalomma asiaticum]